MVGYTKGTTNITYGYDGTGARVSKTQGNTTQKFYWDRGNIINESTNGTMKATNAFGATGIIARQEPDSLGNDATTFMHRNLHGDVIGTFDEDGEFLNSYVYDAYGTEIYPNANDTNPFRYAGEYFDAESGQIYLRNRYYNPSTGRFTQEDPIRDGTNWYTYCAGNPVMYVDPWGLELILQGTGDEVQAIWQTILQISHDDLWLTQIEDENGNLINSYKVTINEIRDGDYDAGSALVRRIINSKKTCTVQITPEDTKEIDVYPGKAIDGQGTDTNIYFNPNYEYDVWVEQSGTGNVVRSKNYAFIDLAHEMIHADRSMSGRAISKWKQNANVEYEYQESRSPIVFGLFGYKPNIAIADAPQEELATVGIAYDTPLDITENRIRFEHRLPARRKY